MTTEPCPACSGTGQTSKPKTLRLHIPKGIEDGMTLRVPGRAFQAARLADKQAVERPLHIEGSAESEHTSKSVLRLATVG